MSDEKPNHNGDSDIQMAAGFLRKGRQARRIRFTATSFVTALRNARGQNHQPTPKRHTDLLPCPGWSKRS